MVCIEAGQRLCCDPVERFSAPRPASPIWSGSFSATPACPTSGNTAITPVNPDSQWNGIARTNHYPIGHPRFRLRVMEIATSLVMALGMGT